MPNKNEKNSEEEKDLKGQGEKGSEAGNGQPEEGEEGGEETITVPKSEYNQIVEDRDNYKAGLLSKKADEREFKKKEEETTDGGTEENLSEEKVKKIAQEASSGVFAQIELSNQKVAQKKFLKDPRHAEYIEDVNWEKLMSSFSSRRGKANSDDVLEDLHDAVILEKRDSGKLDDYLAKGKEQKGNEIDLIAGTGGTGDSKENQKESDTMTPEGEEMAKRMGNEPERIKKVKEGDFTIDLLEKKKE